MAHMSSSAEGRTIFDDFGGPSGSDVKVDTSAEDLRRLRVAVNETAEPFAVQVGGELFDRSVGVVEQSGRIARQASQTCLHEITQAPSRFYEGHLTIQQIISGIKHFARVAIDRNQEAYGLSECKKSCILSALGKCPFAMEDLNMTEESFAELVGIQIKSKRSPTKTQPAGVQAFRFFSKRSFSIQTPGSLIKPEEVIMETSAINHIVKWWVKYKPKTELDKRLVKDSKTKQLDLGI